MSAGAHDRRLLFEQPRDLEKIAPAFEIVPSCLKVRQQPTRTFDAEHPDVLISGVDELLDKILRTVKIRGHEIPGIVRLVPILAIDKGPVTHAHDQRLEGRIQRQAIKRPGVARDAGGDHNAVRPENTLRLSKGPDPVGMIGQMVQRAEQQHGIDRCIGHRQTAGIANGNRGQRLRHCVVLTPRFFDQASGGIDQANGIAQAGQPESVRPRATSDINDLGRRRRQKAANQLFGALELQSGRAGLQPGFLGDVRVVVDDLTRRAVQLSSTSIRLE